MEFTGIMEATGTAIDAAGVAIIVAGAVLGSGLFVRDLRRHGDVDDSYRGFRRRLGRAILLGLEFLVAGDIIRTVAVSPTYGNVGVLAVIVAVRTFLSFSLGRVEGRWPWQSGRRRSGTRPSAPDASEHGDSSEVPQR